MGVIMIIICIIGLGLVRGDRRQMNQYKRRQARNRGCSTYKKDNGKYYDVNTNLPVFSNHESEMQQQWNWLLREAKTAGFKWMIQGYDLGDRGMTFTDVETGITYYLCDPDTIIKGESEIRPLASSNDNTVSFYARISSLNEPYKENYFDIFDSNGDYMYTLDVDFIRNTLNKYKKDYFFDPYPAPKHGCHSPFIAYLEGANKPSKLNIFPNPRKKAVIFDIDKGLRKHVEKNGFLTTEFYRYEVHEKNNKGCLLKRCDLKDYNEGNPKWIYEYDNSPRVLKN